MGFQFKALSLGQHVRFAPVTYHGVLNPKLEALTLNLKL